MYRSPPFWTEEFAGYWPTPAGRTSGEGCVRKENVASISATPNIVFIITDQQRADQAGCYGNPVIQTPNLDRLAREGVRFTRAYAANPLCMPSRSTLMTGLYPSQHGVCVNGIPLKEELLTLPAQLAGQGYRTAVDEVLALDTGFPGPLSHA